jgi:hypothetical protein
VDNYTSYRPDGFLAVSNLNNVVFENITAVYDSNYTDGLPSFRPAIWFPGGYSNLTFRSVTITDVAAHTRTEPIGYSEDFYGLRFEPVDLATNSTGILVYLNSLPENGTHLYDNNVGQTADSTRYYFIGEAPPIIVGP